MLLSPKNVSQIPKSEVPCKVETEMNAPNNWASLESSAINRAVELTLSGQDVAGQLQHLGYQPAISSSAIFELARGFLDADKQKWSRQLFKLVQDLDPVYILEIPRLLQLEVVKLRTRAEVFPWLKQGDQLFSKMQIHKFASGIFDENDSNFVSQRQAAMDRDVPAMSQARLRAIAQAEEVNPDVRKGLRSFEDVWVHFQDQIPGIIMKILKGSVSLMEAKELALRLEQFPVLHAAVRANVYLEHIIIVNNVAPGRDKIYDYRHLVGNAYSSVLISCDRQLTRTAGKICPNLEVLLGDDVFVE